MVTASLSGGACETQPQEHPVPPGGAGLRAAVIAGNEGSAPDLDIFLNTEDPAKAVALWFGGQLARYRGRAELLGGLILRDIAELEDLLTHQINAVLHHPRFQRLEATWRGTALLVSEATGVENTHVRILSVRWAEIARDLDRAAEFDQSQLFNKIYSEEFGMPGGTPYGLLVADFEVAHRPREGHSTDDISVLTGLSQISTASFAPLLLGGAPELFGLQTFRELGLPINLANAMNQPEYQRFLRLRQMEEARFIGVLVPHILLREPHAPGHESEIGFPYREDRFGLALGEMLWGNAAFAYACVVMRAFGSYGWFANIRGAPNDEIGGGMVTFLPQPDFDTDRTGIAPKYCTDVAITDKVEKNLNDLGFIALKTAKDTPYAVFYGNQSLYLPRDMTNAAANANERLSSMIRYMLCVARFAHYVKVMVRDRVGRFEAPEHIESFLGEWLLNYVSGSDSGGEEIKARYPLRDGRVQVREVPGKPGAYHCIMHIQPHFHLDHVVSSFRLVTELGTIGASR